MFKGLEDVFTGRRGKLFEYNKAIVEVVYDYAKSIKTNISLPPIKRDVRAIIVNGNEAAAIGKILGGLRFQTYYPITPAADESFFIEAHNIVSLDPVTEEAKALEKAGVVVVQTEDEISAINMAIGAGIAGARAATATSGPGLSLMVEGTGFAGMNEVPVVITHYQRAGPSTGMATRNSQSDLRFVMHMGHGEFPRIVISSGDHRETIEDAYKALNWAERYQMPVFHLVDKALANSYSTVVWDIDKKALKIDRGLIVTKDDNDYRRFKITKDGVSPRSIPGLGPIFWLTGDEHDEFGHITEDPVTRTEMYEKRMKKLELADREIPITDKVRLYGPESADITLVGWGSTKGVLLDVMNMLNREGYRVNFLQLKMFIPFPSDFVKNALSKGQLIIDVESNYDAQAASVIREKTGIEIRHKVVKVTGRPIFVDEVYDAVKKILKDKDERIILMKGP
ncbi:2-oxoacid:acceptor oxidoreductase subunit alpha [Vulcanisaeta sp. JCM 16159]|uniref:2-oxoacid:acceptor oxidoreductase subunit alpha n=1 Tax=Vulcanisaeta sp. JCM 16159 TaxID=1295371 RepID=UPI001FB2DDB3|nr:2-oxoacid:acceptor oxidoreductase subunit alpha [Vulcanisaeta sp. JCM 16159]